MEEIILQFPFAQGNIYVGEEVFSERLPSLMEGSENFVVTDSNVYTLYNELFQMYFANTPTIILPAGEDYKNMDTLSRILEGMLSSGLHRAAKLFAVGGGVVGDIGGLAASLYMRGISYVQIPTTLLAQIDSSVGGKTAVNVGRVKNIVGAFYQPEEVLIDPSFLNTLPPRELACGLGEIVKYGVLEGKIFDRLQENVNELHSLSFLQSVILPCIRKKASVVERDEREFGERKCLNVGHTTGHAIELHSGLSHGESVLCGIYLETLMAIGVGVCEEEYGKKLLEIVEKALGAFSTPIPDFGDIDGIVKTALLDKKNVKEGEIRMTVASKKGEWAMFSIGEATYKKSLAEGLETLRNR